MKIKGIIDFILSLCCLATVAGAQTNSQKNESEKARSAEVAIIALGPKPPRKFKKAVGGNGQIMQLPKLDETPPARLYHRGEKEGNGGGDWAAMNLVFNSPAILRQVPAEQELKLYRKLPGENNFEPYVTVPAVPAGMRRIFFLMPSKYGPTPWKESPRLKTLELENADLVGKNLILVNFSKYTVQHAFDESVESVAPEAIIAYNRDQKAELYRLAALYGSQKKIIYNTAVRINSQAEIQLFVLYNGSSETNAGRDVGVFRMVIPAKQNELTPERN